MSEFGFRAGEELTLWVKDRSSLSAFYAITTLQKSLAQMGVPCVLRGNGALPAFSLTLNRGQHPGTVENLTGYPADSFRTKVGIDPEAVSVVATDKRGLTYGIWNLLELLGWSWPTPSLERTPEGSFWTIPEMDEISTPALPRRILFLEEVQITPEILVWFSKQGLNTLFPSNPSRFSDPEVQFSDTCMDRAVDLGFDFIIGGAWWDWIGLGGEDSTGSFGSDRASKLADRALEMWARMGDPPPRVSVWPVGKDDSFHLELIEEISTRDPSLSFETMRVKGLKSQPPCAVLYRVPDPEWILEESWGSLVDRMVDACGANALNDESYVSFGAFSDDARLGYAVTPFLWPSLLLRVKAVSAAGLAGACIDFRSLPLSRFLESAGFAVSLAGRGMWHGQDWDETGWAKKAVQQQFESTGGVIANLVADFADWTRKSKTPEVDWNEQARYPFQFAGEILRSERVRDKLDERISEIEESPPCEPCLELIRNLTTLVNLYDLEHTEDIHEATATARTIWRKNEIDVWPEWLRKRSALVERLTPYL